MFSHQSSFLQHYSKVHAHRSLTCDVCGLGFPTDVYLKRHKKTSCGKKFSCLSCHKSYGVAENLKVFCNFMLFRQVKDGTKSTNFHILNFIIFRRTAVERIIISRRTCLKQFDAQKHRQQQWRLKRLSGTTFCRRRFHSLTSVEI